MPQKFTAGWKDYFLGGLGGGAVHALADSFISKMLPTDTTAIAGITLKDIAVILLGKYGADRTRGMYKAILEGMTVIGIYKVLYPQFIQPIIEGLPFSPTSNPGHSNPNPEQRIVQNALGGAY